MFVMIKMINDLYKGDSPFTKIFIFLREVTLKVTVQQVLQMMTANLK